MQSSGIGRAGKHNFHLVKSFMYIILLIIILPNSHNHPAKQVLFFFLVWGWGEWGGGNSGSETFSHSVVSRETERVEFRIDSEHMIFSLYHSVSITKEKLPKKIVNLNGTYEPRQAVEVLTFEKKRYYSNWSDFGILPPVHSSP